MHMCRKVHTLIGHHGEVSCAQFNHEGVLVATGSMDKTCKLWDARTGACVTTLRYGVARVWGEKYG